MTSASVLVPTCFFFPEDLLFSFFRDDFDFRDDEDNQEDTDRDDATEVSSPFPDFLSFSEDCCSFFCSVSLSACFFSSLFSSF